MVDSSLTEHIGLSVSQTRKRLHNIICEYRTDWHLYLCGPAPMMETARNIAAERGWPDEAVRFEYFANNSKVDDSEAFEVHLAKSGKRLSVPEGHSLLQALRQAGVNIESSCEQGACGTCVVEVLEGKPLHQDVYLSKQARATGDRMMSCISRARSPSLVLNL